MSMVRRLILVGHLVVLLALATAGRTPKAARPLRTTERDLAILRFVGKAGIASFDQLYNRHWPGCSRQTASDRLLILKRAGLLTMHYTDARGERERVYALTKEGRALLPQAEQDRVRAGLAPRSEHKQQLLAQEYRIRLERKIAEQGGRLVEWYDERELKSERERQKHQGPRKGQGAKPKECADARAVIEHADGHQEQIEIEIDGQYYGKMLDDKMQGLAAAHRPVVYVCLPARLKRVQAAAAPYPDIHVEALADD